MSTDYTADSPSHVPIVVPGTGPKGPAEEPLSADAEAMALDASAGLDAVLAAWHAATVRLEQTHEALRQEVMRLTDELEKKNRELARKNRLADLGRMAAHVAHEIRNTLVPVSLYVSLLERTARRNPDQAELIAKMKQAFTSVERTVGDLLQFAADREPKRQRVRLRDLLEEIATGIMPQLIAQQISVLVEADVGLGVPADRDMLRRAILNLVLNAVDAMPEGGVLTLRAEEHDEFVVIQVLDTGTGLSEEAVRRAFEPFFTDKKGGTGLGLAIVERVAEVHNGRVVAANRDEGGACFSLCLPKS